VNDQDIIRTIGYITDDRYIATYHGVDVKRVTALRKQVSEHKAKVAKAIYTSHKTAPTGMNSDSERRWNANAKEGSKDLLAALNKFFEKRVLEKGQSK
jgi:ribosomal protein L10